ncbi:MAG: hypothetical protein COY58_05935 [Gammaproteobacteria bacterium CG_4_10_14_0_8_um_filter_38_16]|nr:MAG: hypothetical protein COY58_05935 [Gammaproteobacteria bacterium CG_4_10_14_0_8_um_filter_38_16]
MAKLNAAQRKQIPKSKFGLPEKVGKNKEGGEAGRGAYPMPDKSHAANAKARATQQLKKGNLTKSEKAKIDAKANKILANKTIKKR